MKLQGVDWPEFGLTDDVRVALAALARAGQPAVLATLYASEGGSPRGMGAQMLFGAEAVTGYLSGGCVEADVALHAEQVLAEGRPRRLVYGQGGPADVRLPCGGRIEALLERLGPDDPAVLRLLELTAARRPALWLTDGEHRACLAEGDAAPAHPALAAAFALARTGGVCGVSGEPFAVFRRADPVPRLVVIGADPPALAMARLGALIGLQTSFVRPRGPTSPPPLGEVGYLRSAPAEALAKIGMDPWTSVAVATHDAELDHEALAAALPSGAGYVGVLGSRRKLPERLDRLRAEGLSQSDLGRLKAPIGLPLRGKSPWEIAVAVIGEIVQAARAREQSEPWPEPQPRLEAIVLAAGQASRFGAPKLLAMAERGRVLEGALAAAFAAPVRTVTVVTGAHAEGVAAAAGAFAATRADGERLRIVHADDHALGLSASLRRGLQALPEDAAGAFLFLGDMPKIPRAVLQPLAAALAAGAPAAAPIFEGQRGHPVLVSRELFADLLRLEGDRGAAPVIAALGDRLALVEAPDDGVHYDVDHPSDLERGRAAAI